MEYHGKEEKIHVRKKKEFITHSQASQINSPKKLLKGKKTFVFLFKAHEYSWEKNVLVIKRS